MDHKIESKKQRLEKIFLLVFHGGLVCYLVLHNLLIPMTRNLGQGNPLRLEVHYWFIPQLVLFFLFVKAPLKIKNNGWVLCLLATNATVFLLGIIDWAAYFQGSISLESFSSGISLLSIGIFFLVYFLYFQRHHYWSLSNMTIPCLSAIVLGTGFFFIQRNAIFHNLPKQTTRKESIPVESPLKVIRLPAEDSPNKGHISIGSPSYKGGVSYVPSRTKLVFENDSDERRLLRLEYMIDRRFGLVKILNIKPHSNISFTHSEEKDILRLRPSTDRDLGIHYIVVGANKFDPATYEFYKNRVDIR